MPSTVTPLAPWTKPPGLAPFSTWSSIGAFLHAYTPFLSSNGGFRCTTSCLLCYLFSAYPDYALCFQFLIALDFSSHYMHMYRCGSTCTCSSDITYLLILISSQLSCNWFEPQACKKPSQQNFSVVLQRPGAIYINNIPSPRP